MKRVPILATLVVLAAVATMIGLGIWQLQRKAEKEALIAAYAAAKDEPPIAWPVVPPKDRLPLFRAATGNCLQVMGFRTAPGSSAGGEPGYSIVADCRTGGEGPGMAVQLGWSKNPNAGREWQGGLVSGIIAPDSKARMRLVADTPGPGLMASEPPSTDTIPNNHLSYAIQWFLFAGIALVIYVLVLRKRQREEAANG